MTTCVLAIAVGCALFLGLLALGEAVMCTAWHGQVAYCDSYRGTR